MEFYLQLAVMYKLHTIIDRIDIVENNCTITLGISENHKDIEGLGVTMPTAYLVCNQLESFLDSDNVSVVYNYVAEVPQIDDYLARFGADEDDVGFFKEIVDGISGMFIL